MKDQAQELIAYGADIVVWTNVNWQSTIPSLYAMLSANLSVNAHPAISIDGATTIGRDLGPRLSARLTTGLTADCTGPDISPEK